MIFRDVRRRIGRALQLLVESKNELRKRQALSRVSVCVHGEEGELVKVGTDRLIYRLMCIRCRLTDGVTNQGGYSGVASS